MKQVFAPLRSMADKLFKNMPVVLQGFEYFKKVEKMDMEPNKMQDIGKVRQSFLEKVRRKMEHTDVATVVVCDQNVTESYFCCSLCRGGTAPYWQVALDST